MTRSSSERAGLRLLALLDVAAVELRLPSEFEVPSHPHFAAGRFRFTVVTLVMLGMFLLTLVTVFIAMFGSPYGSMRLAGCPCR